MIEELGIFEAKLIGEEKRHLTERIWNLFICFSFEKCDIIQNVESIINAMFVQSSLSLQTLSQYESSEEIWDY
jgi:hypothetical protein